MKRHIVAADVTPYKMNDGNTTAIWVGIEIGTIKPVRIEALFRDDAQATEFQTTVNAYGDVDEMADAIVRHAKKYGAEQVVVSTDDDAIILKR